MKQPKGGDIPCQDFERKARKEHRCHWCGEKIRVGEKHYQCKGHWEGDWQDWRMHKLCLDRNRKYIAEGFEPYEYDREMEESNETQRPKEA